MCRTKIDVLYFFAKINNYADWAAESRLTLLDLWTESKVLLPSNVAHGPNSQD